MDHIDKIQFIPPKQTDPREFPKSPEAPEGMKSVRFTDDPEYNVDLKVDVVYCQRGDVSLHLEIFVPAIMPFDDQTKTFPLVVYVQGSAWRKQNLLANLSRLSKVAAKGYVCAVVEYRHTGIASFPAQVLDAKEAIRFLKRHADEYHIDTGRIALWGDSSGGHVSAVAGISGERALTEESDTSCEVNCIIDWFGPVDIASMNCVPSASNHVNPESSEGMLIGGLNVTENLELARQTDPRIYIDPDIPTPPMLIMHGDRDMLVPFQQSCLLYEAMRDAGKDVTFYRLEDANHGFFGFCSEGALNLVLDFLQANLGQE